MAASVEWVLAAKAFKDDELPSPFDSVAPASNNLGVLLWVHLPSGAMIAAVPTGPWNQRGWFHLYYAAPRASRPLSLQLWSGDLEAQWDGTDPRQARAAQDAVMAFVDTQLGVEGDQRV